ncbi:hypothetical protein B9Z55_017917 [Caenorhabditis nigoni]|nr:hypothetical protein B9Z55_017917 [Caenorhabditis nigoni]
MIVFAVCSMIYSIVEVFTEAVIHIKGPVFIVFMDNAWLTRTGWGNEVTTLYCASFALVISLLAVQFFYRYVVTCKPILSNQIEGKRLTLLFIPCLVCFVLWFELVYFGMANTVEKQEYMREELKVHYNVDSRNLAFIAPMYWSTGNNGEKKWNILDCIGSLGCAAIITVCLSTIIFCAWNIYSFLKKSQSQMSPKTLEMNRQFFRTLTFQTLFPFFTLYSQVGLLLLLPVFEVYVAGMANSASACVAVYPCLEPLIAIFCIKPFRRTVMCDKRRKVNSCTTDGFSAHRPL